MIDFINTLKIFSEVLVNKICKDIRIVDPDSYIDSSKSNFYSVYHYIKFQQRENYELKGFYKNIVVYSY